MPSRHEARLERAHILLQDEAFPLSKQLQFAALVREEAGGSEEVADLAAALKRLVAAVRPPKRLDPALYNRVSVMQTKVKDLLGIPKEYGIGRPATSRLEAALAAYEALNHAERIAFRERTRL